MGNRCYCCGISYGRALRACPTCRSVNYDHKPDLPIETVNAYLKKYESKKSDITQPMMNHLASAIIAKYGLKPTHLEVKPGQTGVLEIKSENAEHTDLEILYNPYTLQYYDAEEIDAMMHHEIFHPLTMKTDNRIPVDADMPPELIDYITDFTGAYHEYINYAEFINYYKTNNAFARVKKLEVANYGLILSELRTLISRGMPTPLLPHMMSVKILLDAIYFFLVNRQDFADWAKRMNVSNLTEYYQWIVDDMRVIHDSRPEPDQMFRLTQLIGHMTTSVVVEDIIKNNELQFTSNSIDRFTDAAQQLENGVPRQIASNWLERARSRTMAS